MYKAHRTHAGNNRLQNYIETRLTDLHYHGIPGFKRIKHNFSLFIISIFFMSLLPFVHIAIIYKLIWVPDKAEVDRSGCSCSCFDTVFRGSYENPGVVLYKHIYFNSTWQTFKIWIATLFFILLTYESIKYLYHQFWPQIHIRWNMFALYVINIYPHYYSWWSIFNYYNEDFYVYFNHHIYFLLTELLATGIVLNMCNSRNEMSHWKMLGIIIISMIHILVSSVDQFIVHVIYGHGTNFQNVRNIALMVPDILHVIICAREIVKLHKNADSVLSVNNYKEEFGVTFVLIGLGTLFGKLL